MTATEFLQEMVTWAPAGMVACVVVRIGMSIVWAAFLFGRGLISDTVAER